MPRIVTVILLWAAAAQAQTTAGFTLRDAISAALSHHPEMEAFQQRTSAAEGYLQQAALKPNLRLFMQSENTRFWGLPKFSYADATDNWFYFGHRLETAGKRKLRVEVAQTGVNQSNLDRQLFARQLSLRVAMAYWAASGASRSAELARDQAANFVQLVEDNRRRVVEGMLPEADLMRSEIELQRLLAVVDQADADATRSNLQLLREMGEGEAHAIQMADPIEDVPEITPPDPQQVTRRIEWKLAEEGMRRSEANQRLQKAYTQPDIEMLYGYKRTAGFDTLMGGVQIELPLRNRNQGAITAAFAETRAVQAQQRSLRIQIASEIQSAWNDFRTRRGVLETKLLPAQRAAAENADLQRKAYTEGGIDLLRVIDAERLLLDIRTQVVRAQVELRQAQASLSFATGEEP